MSEEERPPAPPADAGAGAGAESADPWGRLRRFTRARIGLGRSGAGLPTAASLDFQFAQARARDAVHRALDVDALAAALAPLPVLRTRSAAPDRSTYLRRPDLGRRLAEGEAARLPAGPWDLVFVIADGLSAEAVEARAAALTRACVAALPGLRIGPAIIVEQGRVAIGDAIGEALGARLTVVLIGERPGLTVADSLGAYLTFAPRPGRADSERNCVSNIHEAGGLEVERAARIIAWLAREALRLELTGTGLKENAEGETLLEGTAVEIAPPEAEG